MLNRIILATLITAGATAAYAQSPTAAPQTSSTPPAVSSPAVKPMPSQASADTRKLIGRNIQNAQNETIGEIKSVFIGKDGNVDSVMVGVGGFLGMGEREVRLNGGRQQLAPHGVAAFAVEHLAGLEVALGGGHHVGVPAVATPVGSPRSATLATDTPTSRPIRCQRLYSVK
jgi:hypothetical protein